MKALVIPPAAQRDASAIQMLSAWIAENGLHCSINVGVWEKTNHKEATAWGILLADTIRHISNALHEQYGVAAPDSISAILESLHNELGNPTSAVQGGFQPGHS